MKRHKGCHVEIRSGQPKRGKCKPNLKGVWNNKGSKMYVYKKGVHLMKWTKLEKEKIRCNNLITRISQRIDLYLYVYLSIVMFYWKIRV